jgi:hypothetical protein
VDPGGEPVARAHGQPPAELGADPAAPERRLHRDRELGHRGPRPLDRLQLADAARLAGDEAAEDDGAGPVEAGAVGPDPLLARVPAEPEPPVLRVEAEEVRRQQPAALAKDEAAKDWGGDQGFRHRPLLVIWGEAAAGPGDDERAGRWLR